ncbi:MAG: HAMP domain-containing histidine kinase [Pirellulales bacterium]|nr:HAMP domain-containing histidine kinase [Pirellulales bacterium]
MSYRSLKRVLGETSLERKCRFLFGACLLVLIALSFWWYGEQTNKLVFDQNHKQAHLLVRQRLLSLHVESLAKQEDVKETLFKEELKSLTDMIEEKDYEWRAIIPDRRKEYPNQRFLLEPANLPRGEKEVMQKEAEWLAYFDKPRPVNADASEPIEFRERISSNGKFYEYYEPVYCGNRCKTRCHQLLEPDRILTAEEVNLDRALLSGRSAAYQVGDLLAVIHVTMDNKPTQDAMDQNRAILIATAVVTVFLAMVAAYLIVRYVVVKPLKHLRDVSDAISHGNTSLRAEIHTGDEFEGLGVAFNRMLRHLIHAQEELRHVNVDLDNKVDELAQANMQLYEMNRLKSDFLATMSHELRTPLNSILGFSDVLVAIESLSEKQRRYVENIQKSGRTLLEMINDILDLAKMESGRFDVRPSSFTIEQIIGAQCDMARPLAERKNIDLEMEVQPGLPLLHQDQARVQQILNNLLSNAIKFTPEGGRIKVSAGRNDADQLVLQVADTGVGIAAEELDTIFQKFRQGGNALTDGDAITREYSGSGLGLSIVRELCKLLGGEITAESQLGQGSVFTVHLPWTLQDEPRLDSPMSEEFDKFVQARVRHLQGKPNPSPPSLEG